MIRHRPSNTIINTECETMSCRDSVGGRPNIREAVAGQSLSNDRGESLDARPSAGRCSPSQCVDCCFRQKLGEASSNQPRGSLSKMSLNPGRLGLLWLWHRRNLGGLIGVCCGGRCRCRFKDQVVATTRAVAGSVHSDADGDRCGP